ALLRPRRARRAGALLAARSRAGTHPPAAPRRGREGLPGRHRAVRRRHRLPRPGRQTRALRASDRLHQRRSGGLPRRPPRQARRRGPALRRGRRGRVDGAHRPRRRRGRLRLGADDGRRRRDARPPRHRRPVRGPLPPHPRDEEGAAARPHRGPHAADLGDGGGAQGRPLGRPVLGRGPPVSVAELRQPERLTTRGSLPSARRIVVKIGSSSLTDDQGGLDQDRIRAIADTAAELAEQGTELVIVSSGAIAAALGPLGLPERPAAVALQQAAASVGQSLLATAWQGAFARHGRTTGQARRRESDVSRPQTYRNVRTALEALLELGTVPVVNENDTTATHEIRFGDNDRLAALVAQLLGADALILLTDVDALYTAPPREPGAERIGQVEDVARLTGVNIGSVGSKVGTGGMVTKLSAAQLASATGTAALMTS